MHDERASIAANNNADLYEIMFAAHGARFRRHAFAFVGEDSPPPYYSHLTVLSPGQQSSVLAQIRALSKRFGGAVGFKDSFCEFDLREEGFRTIFEAKWFWAEPMSSSPTEDWMRIARPSDLEDWEAAWKRNGSPTEARMFKGGLLRHPDIALFGRRSGGAFVAGCIANRSAACVGLSNVFSSGDLASDLRGAKVAAGSFEPRLPIAGYAAGTLLQAAEQVGFEIIGDLRVQLAKDGAD